MRTGYLRVATLSFLFFFVRRYSMTISRKVKALILLLGVGIAFVALGAQIRNHYSEAQLMQHCINVNKGNILPYPDGCVRPIRVNDGVFEFINVNGQKEMYVVVRLRNGTFRYAKVRNS